MKSKLGLFALCLVILPALSSTANAQEARSLTIERLYSLPRLIGTQPKSFAWSRDSRRLAFLWNDEGTNFYDVWMIGVDDPEPKRVTRMPQRTSRSVDALDLASIADLRALVSVERDPGVTSVEWDPDGQHVLLGFRGDLYLADVDGTPANPRQITETPKNKMHASYSPNGRFAAYLEHGNLWLVEIASENREPREIAHFESKDVEIRSYRWSPNGLEIAVEIVDSRGVPTRGIPDYLEEETTLVSVRRPFPGEDPPNRYIGVVSADGGKIRRMNPGGKPGDPIFSYRWSPDGRRLLVDRSDLYVKDRHIVSVESETGIAQEIYREAEPENVTAEWQAEWTPDGNGFYFLSDRDEDYHIYFLPVTGGTPQRITRGDWAVSRFHVSTEAEALYFVANEGRREERHIYKVGLEGGEPVRLSRTAGTHAPTFSPDGRYAAVHFSSDETPPDLMLTSLQPSSGEETERRITSSPLAEFNEYRWVAPEYVTFESHVNGATLNGRLTLPADLDKTKKHPAILGSVYSNTVRNQWGGRTAHPTWGLDQYLVQEGYILLNVDFRGSWGHGRAHRRGIRLDYGGIDTEDIYSGVKYLESLGFVDMERVGIWGSSYGGLLTCMSLFKKPGVYKAGVAGAPATNVWHALTGEMMVMMAPVDQPAEYADSSAFTHAGGLEDHLMIIHGMRDRVVLFKDSVTLAQRLMMMGKDVDLVALPDSGHGWDNESLYQTVFAFKKLVGHFERYLGKGPS